MLLKSVTAALLAVFLAGSASAATVSSTGQFLQIATPTLVNDAGPGSNSRILYYNERQTFRLINALVTDQGTIAAGTQIDSHMVFLNRATGSAQITRSGTLTFASAVLGTISDRNGTLRLSPSDYLGAPTVYTNFAGRGIEGADSISFVGNTFSATLIASQPGDWVRVITTAAVPVPAGMFLMPLALGALGAMRRRRKAA